MAQGLDHETNDRFGKEKAERGGGKKKQLVCTNLRREKKQQQRGGDRDIRRCRCIKETRGDSGGAEGR